MDGVGVGIFDCALRYAQAAAAAPAFDPAFEYSPDPGFDLGTGTAVRCAVSGSALTATSNTAPSYTMVATAPFVAGGVYRVTAQGNLLTPGIQLATFTSGNSTLVMGGSNDLTITDATSLTNIRISLGGGNLGNGLTSLSVKRIS